MRALRPLAFLPKHMVFVGAAIAVAAGWLAPARAETKVALIIGNSSYQNVSELPNPVHDARDVAAAFRRLGFSVRLVTDTTYDNMRRALLEFSQDARSADMAAVFFAGHGMEIGGENWLIPVDAELKSDLDTEQEAIPLRSVILVVSAATRLGLVVLDACRNNPFLAKMKRTVTLRAVSRGLSPVEPTNNVLVAFAAKDGTTAADGRGRNSPFTTALLKHVERPGLEVSFIFRNVRDDVIAATHNEQQPFIYGSLSRELIYLRPPPVASAAPTSDEFAWSLIQETTDKAALKRFAAQYPDSPLREDAEARIAALEAAQPARPIPPGADEVTWEVLKETTDQAALRRFIAQYPKSPLRNAAEARLMALEASTKDAPVGGGDSRELARALQLELKRVGCFAGKVNGEFDGVTKKAWHKFTELATIDLPDVTTLDAIKAIRLFDRRVCPIVCRDGERADGEHCVANPVPPPKRAAREAAPASGAAALCATYVFPKRHPECSGHF